VKVLISPFVELLVSVFVSDAMCQFGPKDNDTRVTVFIVIEHAGKLAIMFSRARSKKP